MFDSMTAKTNYHKLGGLKQHKLIILFCTSGVLYGLHWAKSKVLAGLCFFWESLRETPFNLPFSASRGYLHFLTLIPLFHFILFCFILRFYLFLERGGAKEKGRENWHLK